uniref:Carboxypeptidase inhibitor n=1 Tax=Rhipicephalus appendiculatus TaxID=34631 RepID=A0A131YT45_RHIAP
MMLIFLFLTMSFASNMTLAFKRGTCHTSGYGCMPFNQCMAKYWAVRSGCGLGSVCCNLGKKNACLLAGGICKRHCRTPMKHIRCSRFRICCSYEPISYRPHGNH